MINVPMKTSEPLNIHTISTVNQRRVEGAQTRLTITSINNNSNNSSSRNNAIVTNQNTSQRPSISHGNNTSGIASNTVSNATQPSVQQPSVQQSRVQQAPAIVNKPIPLLRKPTQKGQKVALEGVGRQARLKVCLGWNVLNPQCDVDVSAFLLGGSGKVIGYEWFVFYGQTKSPDSSVCFYEDNGADREYITIDFGRLNPNVTKIVFVLTINEAFEKRLNFSMLKDAYIRILDGATLAEHISFKMTDYYINVSSMMIGEIYLYNNNWKFNAVGNGVAKDLAGLCDLYGVQTI